MRLRRILFLSAFALASVAFATPEAQVGNVLVSSDLLVVVLPGGLLNPHLRAAVIAPNPSKPIRVRIGNASPTSRHTLEHPDRTVRVEVVVDGRTTEFAEFPFPLAMERGEVYDVRRVQQEFGYSLYLALKLAADNDPLFGDAADVDRRVRVLVEGLRSLRRLLPEMPEALQFILPPFLDAAQEKIRAASADCADALAGKSASLPTRAVALLVAEQFLLDVMTQVGRW